MRKKGMLFLMILTGVTLLGVLLLPGSSFGITPREVTRDTPLDTATSNLRVERIFVKEIGDSQITSSDGKIIRFNTTTNIYKKRGDGSKMVIAELHYVHGRLAAIYLLK